MKITMRYIITLFIILITLAVLATKEVSAAPKVSGASATLSGYATVKKADNRVKILEAYLTKYNSPLAAYADVFVAEADKNNLDWKFVAAISGVESTFGKRIPYNSYNAWGWGVYGDNVLRFESWEDGIATISHGLRTKYMDKWGAEDIYSIGRIYAASPTWAQKVTYFSNKIEKFEKEYTNAQLSISI